MKIHSDTLTWSDLEAATDITHGARGYWIYAGGKAGSRKRKHGFEVFLTGNSPYAAQRLSDNGGTVKAATYDEWGMFLAALYGVDENMIAGPYVGVVDFNEKTDWKFA